MYCIVTDQLTCTSLAGYGALYIPCGVCLSLGSNIFASNSWEKAGLNLPLSLCNGSIYWSRKVMHMHEDCYHSYVLNCVVVQVGRLLLWIADWMWCAWTWGLIDRSRFVHVVEVLVSETCVREEELDHRSFWLWSVFVFDKSLILTIFECVGNDAFGDTYKDVVVVVRDWASNFHPRLVIFGLLSIPGVNCLWRRRKLCLASFTTTGS